MKISLLSHRIIESALFKSLDRDVPLILLKSAEVYVATRRNLIAVKYRPTQISFSKESARSAILRERRRNDFICGGNWF
jgi:hypothetical protein